MTLSLIIPTYRRPQKISALLKSISQQEMNKEYFEVLIVGNISCSETQSICEDYKKLGLNISYFETGKVGVNFARNAGLEKARGEFCAFLDDDCQLPDHSWLTKVINNFNTDLAVDGYGGFYQILGNHSFWGLIYYIKLRSLDW